MRLHATILFVIGALLIGIIVHDFWLQSTAAPRRQVVALHCMDNDTRERLRTIMTTSIDQAIQQHVVRMFDIWMKDPSEQPRRAVTGMQNAVKAYTGAREVVKEWNPQPCPE